MNIINQMDIISMKEDLIKKNGIEQANAMLEDEFKNILKDSRSRAYKELGVTEEEMERAKKIYGDEKEYKHIEAVIDNLNCAIFDKLQKFSEIPAVLSEDTVIDIITNNKQNSVKVIKELMNKLANSKGITVEKLQEEMKENPQIYQDLVNESIVIVAQKDIELFRKYKVTCLELNSAIEKYSNNAEFGKKLEQIYNKMSAEAYSIFDSK